MPKQTQQKNFNERIVPFTAGDGFSCNLIHVRGDQPPVKGPVLLVHGAGVRGNIFRPPNETTLVDFLSANGYDVWLSNWRASIDLAPNDWTLDQAALYDHPAAVQTVIEETGATEIKAIIHCQGSTSFTMSAIAGLVPQVKTIISNAVSLHPIVPRGSRIKLSVAVPLVSLMTDHLNPRWGVHAPTVAAKLIKTVVELTHHECDNPVCKQVSFTYGTGFPALWRHENLTAATHEWIKQEFGFVPIRFFNQIARCVRSGHLVSVEGKKGLPEDFAAIEPQTNARFSFLAGGKNLCFLPESQQKSFEHFDRFRKNYHTFHLFPEYSHLDVFFGKAAAKDTFPVILDELDRPR